MTPAPGARRALATNARVLAALLTGAAFVPFLAAADAGPGARVATVRVDAREASRGILKAHLSLPVAPGALTLVYPKWLPGRHGPAGPITSLALPSLTANRQPLAWRRDAVDPYAIHLDVPAGVDAVEADLEVLTVAAPDGIVQGLETPRSATEALAIVEWNQLVLYPAGPPTDELRFQASIVLPAGWQYATALTRAGSGDGAVEFEPTSLTTLVDSTLLAGRYFRSIPLGGSPAVELKIAADRPVALSMAAAEEQHFRDLVAEASALFGATHYRRYQFLWALTDQIMPDGLEHHESSDNRSPLRALLDDDIRRAEANLLPHEYTHSWNGKFRRPAGLATPDYQAPMQDELLWVYEGLTEYLGDVLAARSGLLTVEEFRDELARLAAQMDVHHRREWRSLEDTTIAAPLLYTQDRHWAARLRRQDDFYQESALRWLEADAIIRRESHGQRSLDDFCRRFFGAPSTGPEVRRYDFEAIVAALEAVQPHDWRGFWRERLATIHVGAPLGGLDASGWRLSYGAGPNAMHAAHEAEDREWNLQYSLGATLGAEDGLLTDIVPGSPLDAAGAAPGSHLVAVNGRKWSKESLRDVLAHPQAEGEILALLVEKDGEYRTLELRYADGERIPTLTRTAGEDLLSAIARPRRVVPPAARAH
ncbi:MAG: M61 family metallopeptidase [Proteobacteria bacterium]|nr:M61 family metallopeptidase [Pseudomonadota bacterium]